MRSEMSHCNQSRSPKKYPLVVGHHWPQVVMLHRNCHHMALYKVITGWNGWLYIFRCCSLLVSQQCLSFSVLFENEFWCLCDTHSFRFGKACVWMVCGVCLATVSILGFWSLAALGPQQWFLLRWHACYWRSMYLLYPSFVLAESFKNIPLKSMPLARKSQG